FRPFPLNTAGFRITSDNSRMTQSSAPQFLDVPTLLERSPPRGPGVRLWQVLGMFALVVMFSTYLSSRSSDAARVVNLLSMVLMIMLMGALAVISWTMFRRARTEQLTLEGSEELIRLRRWPEAAGMLEQMLAQPTRT